MSLKNKVNNGFNTISLQMGIPITTLWYEALYAIAANKVTKGRPWELLGEVSLDQIRYNKRTLELMEDFLPTLLLGVKRHTLTDSLISLSSKSLKDVPEAFNPNWALLYEIISVLDLGPYKTRVIRKWNYSYSQLLFRARYYWKHEKSFHPNTTFPEYFKKILVAIYYHPDRNEILEMFMKKTLTCSLVVSTKKF